MENKMKFMVAYDGSEVAKSVVMTAQHHARVWHASLEIVKVFTRSEPLKHKDVSWMECELGEELKKICGKDDTPFGYQLLLTQQEPGEKLVEFARDENIDQVFLGISKRSKVGKLVFGSTAQYIILNAPCPVVSISKT